MNKTPEMARMGADLAASEALREQFDAAMKRIAEAGEAQSDGELFEKAAAELGYQVAAAELERLTARNEEIGPEEMEQATGGEADLRRKDGDRNAPWCVASWHCYTALLHTKANTGNDAVACWSDYNCVWVIKGGYVKS